MSAQAEVVEQSEENNEDSDEVTVVPLANVSVTKTQSGQLAAGEQAAMHSSILKPDLKRSKHIAQLQMPKVGV